MRKIFVGLILIGALILFSQNFSFAKLKTKEMPQASCSGGGAIECPKGFKPNCPKQHTPSCVFIGTKYMPSCLADSPDNTVFNYRLDKITCKKGK